MGEFAWTFENIPDISKEVWNQTEGKFAPLKVLDLDFDLTKHNIDFLNIKSCQNQDCKSSDYYPKFFDYCPSCGANLIPLSTSFTNSWASPYGTHDGSRSLLRWKWNQEELSRINELTKSSAFQSMAFQLPEGGGKFSFIITEGSKSLIALDRARDKTRVFSYSTVEKRWFLYDDSVPGFSGPPWAWSATIAKNGFAFPSDEGPCFVKLSNYGNEFTHDFTLKNNEKCKAIGGAAIWKEIAMIPIAIEANLFVSWYQCDGEGCRSFGNHLKSL